MAESNFWENYGPGLLGTGIDLFNLGQQRDADTKRRERTQGPLYNQQIGLAGQTLSAAGGFDPRAAAAERFGAQQGLLAESDRAREEDLFRRLQKQGLLDVSSFGGVPGTAPTPGVALNPHLASFYAGQAGARQQSAFDALREGERQLDTQLNRSGALQRQAEGSLATRSQPGVQRVIAPNRPSVLSTVLGSGSRILSDPRIRADLGGLLKQGAGYIGGLFGGESGPQPTYFDAPSFDPVSERFYSPEDYYNVF